MGIGAVRDFEGLSERQAIEPIVASPFTITLFRVRCPGKIVAAGTDRTNRINRIIGLVSVPG
jgi:hypothetical protein